MSSKQFQPDQIPNELKIRRQWVGFSVNGTRKTPCVADDPARKASSTDRKTWRAFDTAVAGVQSRAFNAIAFALNKDFIGIDLDECLRNGIPTLHAADIVKCFASYTEISFSGNGVHILLKGTLPEGSGRKLSGVEWYDRARFLICTGNRLPDTPPVIRSNPSVITRILDGVVTEQTEAIFSSPPFLSACSVTYSLDELIQKTLPLRPGERNRRLLNLARGLRFNTGLTNPSLRELKPIVRQWFERSLPVIRTKDFTETWSDFIYAWERARLPLGTDVLSLTWHESQTTPEPDVAGEYDSEPVRHLVGLCAALARLDHDLRFFLSMHSAAELLNTNPMQICRWLKMLVADGVLRRLQVGKYPKASRYQWMGRNEAKPYQKP